MVTDVIAQWPITRLSRKWPVTPISHGVEKSSPDIFRAVEEQLGLKLNVTKGPVEVLVIDKIERPSDN